MNPITPTDYKAAAISGKQRIYGGTFSNPMGGTPSVDFDEELITYDSIADLIIRNKTGGCQASLTDITKPIVLRSPVDDTVIPLAAFIAKIQAQGVITNEDFFIVFYSLGRRTQLARDICRTAIRAQASAQEVYNAVVQPFVDAQAVAQTTYDASPTDENLIILNDAKAALETNPDILAASNTLEAATEAVRAAQASV